MIFGSFQLWRMRKKVCLGIIINLQNHCVQNFYVIMQNLSGSCLHHCMCTYAYIEDKEMHTYQWLLTPHKPHSATSKQVQLDS